MFVTVWLGILEISTGILCFADAGHEKPLLKRDGKWEFIEKEKSGIPLGLFSESPDGAELFSEQTITLHAGDVLFQYTDGVTEAVHEKKLFGEAGLLSAVSGAKSAKPEELLACIRQQIDGFVGQEPQFDDITMMGLMYNGIDVFGKDEGGKTRLSPELESFSQIREEIKGALGNSENTRNIIMVCEEIFTNIVSYSGADEVFYSICRSGDIYSITFTDNGVPFDPSTSDIPDKPVDELDTGGMGIKLARMYSREMEYHRENDRNHLTLKFYIP
jgi:anti-sigma regulatory factor (Ser/Thr protein kinase)